MVIESVMSEAPKLTLIKGSVLGLFDEPVEAIIEVVDNETNEIITRVKSNSKTGKFLVSLPAGKNYGISIQANGYLFHSENFDIPESSDYKEVNNDFTLKKIDIGSNIVLRNIFFDYGKSSLSKASTMELDRLARILQENPTIQVEISGHTDYTGSDEFNQRLSEKRAAAVVNYLVNEKDIERSRLKAVGYGKKYPIASNETEEGRRKNRRTEFKIIGKGE